MFKTIDLLGMLGPVKNAWERLNRTLQTTVEHAKVTNSTGSILDKGTVVYAVAGARRVAPAIADNGPTADWVGVMAEPTAANGQGVMRHSGYAYVKFDTGLTLVSGTPAYVSATAAGVATDVYPVGQWIAKLGVIADTTGFHSTNNPYAWVVLGNCCVDLRPPA